MKTRLWPAAFALLLAACASHPTPPQAAAPQPADPSSPTQPQTAAAESAVQAIVAAESAVSRANSVGFAWRDSEAMIAQAREAAGRQDFATAEKLANSARLQGDLAYRQYLDQTSALRR
jgi:PBP1b-binding outer membrane lipoprotein LpoB